MKTFGDDLAIDPTDVMAVAVVPARAGKHIEPQPLEVGMIYLGAGIWLQISAQSARKLIAHFASRASAPNKAPSV